MYILYLDESGNPDNPADRHFILGGAAIFERTTFYVGRDLDDLQRKYWPAAPPIDFHASPIRAGSGFWRGVPQATRQDLLCDIGSVIEKSNRPGLALFAAVVEKDAQLYGEDAIRCATEQIVKRFDTFLNRRAHDHHNPQRGLLVFAESHYQQRAKVWVKDFRRLGTQWGVLNNLADIPYFAAAKESRLLQVADYVSHATFLLYERRDASLAKGIISRFDQKNGILHGLVHVSSSRGVTCDCPACVSRRAPNTLGPWI